METPFSSQPLVLDHLDVMMWKTLEVGIDLDLDQELDLGPHGLVLRHLVGLALDLAREYEGLDLVLGYVHDLP